MECEGSFDRRIGGYTQEVSAMTATWIYEQKKCPQCGDVWTCVADVTITEAVLITDLQDKY